MAKDLTREVKNKIRSVNNPRIPEMPSARLVLFRKPFSAQLLGDTNYKPPGECQQFSIRGHALIDALPTKFRGSTLGPRRRPSRMAARSRGIPYIDFTAEAPKLRRQLEHARSRQQALDQAGQRSSEEYMALSREIEGLLALVTPSRSLRQPKKRRCLK